MRLISWLILLTSLSACIAKPQPPHGPECLLVAVDGLAPYLHCKDPTNSDTPAWDIPLPAPQKYVCSDLDTYVAAKKYAKDLNDWINANCKGGN